MLALLTLMLVATGTSRTARAAEPATDDPTAFFAGKWELMLHGPEGEIVGKARSYAYPALDGRMMQIDYRGLDRAGNVIFRGTTLRTPRPGGGWIVRWSMAERAGYTYIEERFEGGELRGTGSGEDESGAFLERYRYFDLAPDSYAFQLERSTDDGATWSPGPVARAKRVE